MDACDKLETYTIKVDSIGASNNGSFTGYINSTIRNVVKAELLFASISGNTLTAKSNVAYIAIQELESKFTDRMELQTSITDYTRNPTSNNLVLGYCPIGAKPAGTLPSNVNYLRTAQLYFPLEQTNTRSVFTLSSFNPTDIEYIEPIRQINKLTITLWDEMGVPLTVTGPTFLSLRLTCFKPNVCRYT